MSELDAKFDLEGLDPASQRLVQFVLRLVGGDFHVRGEVAGRGDAVDAVTVALNMLAESFQREHQARARAEELLADAVDTYELAADAFCSLEVGTLRIARSNATLTAILGLSGNELRGRALLEFMPPASRCAATTALTTLAETGAVPSFDVDLEAGGRTMTVSVTGAVKRAEDGRPLRLLLALRDETSARQLAEQLIQAQRLDALGRLAGGIAHDFNNLLTVILASAEMLGRRLADRPRELAEARMVRETAERAAALVNDLLSFARQEDTVVGRVVIDEIVAQAEGMLRRLAGPDVEFEVLLGAPLVATVASPTHLGQAIVNLVVNARDAMIGTGRIAIVTRLRTVGADAARGEGAPVSYGSVATAELAAGSYVELSVEDSGQGIAPDVQARIFEPFFTTKPVGQGTGLGLAIVYSAVRQARGYIRVESSPGEGARFTMLFPRADSLAVVARDAEELPATPGIRLLVVDDDDLVRPLIARVLRHAGFAVVEASSGEAALAMVREQPDRIDLIVSDVMMPGIDGLTLLTAVRELRADLPCLFVTGYAQEEERMRAMSRIGVLHKPFVPSTLVNRVRELLGPAVRPKTTP